MATEPGKRSDSDFAAFGPFRLFPKARLLERDGLPVEIGGRALDVLVTLVAHAGKVVTKSDLMASVWPDVTVVEGVLRVHISSLRKALGEGTTGSPYIKCDAGNGYCFVAPVVRRSTEAALKSLDGPARRQALEHGLPPRLERMAGREETVRALVAQLAEHRFVTIAGAAGIGKTTVAVSVGHELLERFDGAVRFIELASVIDPGRVAATVASSLGVPVQTDDALASLRAFLHDRRVLLVLDNCEHVVEAAAAVAEHLFMHAPHVHLLTTSREALRVEGERVHRLLPLDAPADHRGMDVETVRTFPAVQVFLERAAAGGWSGALRDEDVPVVAEICKRLDGVALALELAASFVGECGFRGTAAMLDDRLSFLLHQGRRTAPPRQHTLQALIAWSYDRLRERDRSALRCLAIFIGTFSMDAARAVACEAGEPEESLVDALGELVARSLLSSAIEEGAVVYRMLETTRLYALERLSETDDLERVSLRHASFFTERLTGALARPAAEPSRKQVSDLANVRAAVRTCFSSPTRYAAGVRLVAAATRMLIELGLVSECQSWCSRALEVIAAPNADTLVEVALQEAFAMSTMFSRRNGDDVRRALARGVELARALGAVDHELRILGHQSSFLIRIGDFRGAAEVAETVAGPSRRATLACQARAKWMLALSHHLCGNQAVAEEHCAAALALESAPVERRAGAPRPPEGLYHLSLSHVATLARTLWLRGHADRALAAARQVVQGIGGIRHPFERSSALILCEGPFVWCGEWAEAERLLDVLSELVERYSLGSQRGAAMALRGEFLVRTGRQAEGCALLRAASSIQKAERNASFAGVYAGALAEGLAEIGPLEEALATLDGAIVDTERRGGSFNLPELLRIKGALLASRSAPDDGAAAEDALSSAVALARAQGAVAWELRAMTTFARERLRRGDAADALRGLRSVYAKLTEGWGSPDVRAARDLLECAVAD